MHVHENVLENGINDFAQTLVKYIISTAKNDYQKDWEVECRHIEKVKSYAPRIMHVVFDIFCTDQKVEHEETEN